MLIILIVIYLLVFINGNHFMKIENMIDIPTPYNENITWSRTKDCNYSLPKVLENIFDMHNIRKSKDNNWDIYIPCSYNNINKEIDKINAINDKQKIFIIDNADQLSGKNMLWINLKNTYGRLKASKLMPNTYLLYDKNDIELFKRDFNNQTIYIMKKNIQRQKGLKITNDKNTIINGFKNGYVIVQELLQNPYLIRGRKINMRFYLLIICKKGEIEAYIYNDGFMYYTRTNFIKHSLEENSNITTGYIDRYVYTINPLTHSDFKKYLDDNTRPKFDTELTLNLNNIVISDFVFFRIYKLFKNTINAIKNTICKNIYLDNYITFQLFGADIALSDKLVPQIMEINKGPDLAAKDPRDRELKKNVVKDTLKMLKLISVDKKRDINNGFIQIY